MTAADRERWDAKYAQQQSPAELSPPKWLVRHAAKLPPGRALDLATGHGHAAIWLAERGWNVTAIDVSPVGIQTARRWAKDRGASVNWLVGDLDEADLGVDAYDLVTLFRFLDRGSLPSRVSRAVRTGGHLIYQTFLQPDNLEKISHPQNPAFLLEPGELPKLFPDFEILEYVESYSGVSRMASLACVKMQDIAAI